MWFAYCIIPDVNKLIILAGVALLVMFLFVYVATNKSTAFFPIGAKPTATPKKTTTTFQTRVINLIVRKGHLVGGPSRITIPQNQMIVLQIVSDTDDIFSILGLGKAVILQHGKMVVLSFLTTEPGTFSYALNNSSYLGNIIVTATK